MSKARRFASFLRAHIAGFEASSAYAAASYLHAKLGHKILPEATKWAVQQGIERVAATSVKTEIVKISAASRTIADELASRGAMQLVRHGGRGVTKVALRQVAGGIGRASLAGFVIDGAIGSVEAYRAYRAGEMDSSEALRHAGIEGVTGAIACGAGVALAAGAVVLTGGLAPSAVLAIGAVGSTGVKYGLRRVADRRHFAVRTKPALAQAGAATSP